MKLKKMIYTAGFTFLLFSPVTAALANGKPNDFKASHITYIPHPNCHTRVFTEYFSYIKNKNKLHWFR